MTVRTTTKQGKRAARHSRVRARVSGTSERPRLAVYKSNTRLFAQIIDDTLGTTLAAVSSDTISAKTPRERIEGAAVQLADAAKKKGISKVVFDRGGFEYTGVIKAFADSTRAAGLIF